MIFVYACLLVAATVAIHSAGLILLVRRLQQMPPVGQSFWGRTWVLIRLVWLLLFIHIAEILVWGLVYWPIGAVPDLQTAVYFSGVSYTTVGFGDVLLPERWQLLGPIQGLTGILMCGLSTAFLLAVFPKLILGINLNQQND